MPWDKWNAGEVEPTTARGFVRIGRMIRRRREALGLSQRQLQRLSGLDQGAISRLENGKLHGLRWSRFARLVEALGGIGVADPLPGWASRFLPPDRPSSAVSAAHDDA